MSNDYNLQVKIPAEWKEDALKNAEEAGFGSVNDAVFWFVNSLRNGFIPTPDGRFVQLSQPQTTQSAGRLKARNVEATPYLAPLGSHGVVYRDETGAIDFHPEARINKVSLTDDSSEQSSEPQQKDSKD